MRIWLILLGVVVALGLGIWLYSSQSPKSDLGAQTPTPVPPSEPQTKPVSPPTSPESTPAELSELLCSGKENAPLPEPRRPTLRVAAACVEVQGPVMFVSKIVDTEDYMVKIWLAARYATLRGACRAVATEEPQIERDLVLTIAKEDWPTFSKVLQPEGPGTSFKYGMKVVAQGVYVFSTETSRQIYGPHCEIHPLTKLELLEEKKEEGK